MNVKVILGFFLLSFNTKISFISSISINNFKLCYPEQKEKKKNLDNSLNLQHLRKFWNTPASVTEHRGEMDRAPTRELYAFEMQLLSNSLQGIKYRCV